MRQTVYSWLTNFQGIIICLFVLFDSATWIMSEEEDTKKSGKKKRSNVFSG